MPRFLVTIERSWLEVTERIIEADNEATARDQAETIYLKARGDLDWGPIGILEIEYIIEPATDEDIAAVADLYQND